MLVVEFLWTVGLGAILQLVRDVESAVVTSPLFIKLGLWRVIDWTGPAVFGGTVMSLCWPIWLNTPRFEVPSIDSRRMTKAALLVFFCLGWAVFFPWSLGRNRSLPVLSSFALFMSLVVIWPALEEWIFRRIVHDRMALLCPGRAIWPVALSSLSFVIWHSTATKDPLSALHILVAGILLACLRRTVGWLWCIPVHSGANLLMSVLLR